MQLCPVFWRNFLSLVTKYFNITIFLRLFWDDQKGNCPKNLFCSTLLLNSVYPGPFLCTLLFVSIICFTSFTFYSIACFLEFWQILNYFAWVTFLPYYWFVKLNLLELHFYFLKEFVAITYLLCYIFILFYLSQIPKKSRITLLKIIYFCLNTI